MRDWHVGQLAGAWLIGAIVIMVLVVIDLRRSTAFAIPLRRAATWRDRLLAARALARALPFAVGALVLIPPSLVGVTVWWIYSRT